NAADLRGERLDFEAIDGDDGMAVVHEVVRQVEAGRTETDHQDRFAAVRPRDRAADVERIPASQQTVDLEAPGQLQHVLEYARLALRDVDRLLLLVDAGFHAVVADSVPGRRAERIVDGDHGKRADRMAVAFNHVHLGDL